MPRRHYLLALFLSVTACVAQQPGGFGVSLAGNPLTELAPPGTKAVVLFFVATDCPVSNRSFPEMKRLSHEFSSQAVRFWFVYPNATEKPAEIRAHQHAFDAADANAVIMDPDSALVRLAHAVVTPQAAVLIATRSGWKPVYTGRVDDRFVRIGLERPAPTLLLADRAIRELLAGKSVTPDPGTPVGCGIISARSLHP